MHSQNGVWENDESRNQGSNRVTEKTTLVVARLQSVKMFIVCDSNIGDVTLQIDTFSVSTQQLNQQHQTIDVYPAIHTKHKHEYDNLMSVIVRWFY
jgi:hypothetical protein